MWLYILKATNMFYDNKNKIIVDRLPKNSIGPDGNIFIDFNKAQNINLWADHGYYEIRNDNPIPPSELSEEDTSQRLVILDYPYADITRVWKNIEN